MVETLLENTLPTLKTIIRREDCRTITDLLDRVVKRDLALEKEAGDRMLEPPGSSTYPETVYQPMCDRRSKAKATPVPTIAGAQFDKSKSNRTPTDEVMCAICDEGHD